MNDRWKIIELFDKKLIGDAALNKHEQALPSKVIKTYEKMNQPISAVKISL